MFNVSTVDSVIALSGFGAGLLIGSLNNIRKTGSLYRKPHDGPKQPSFIVKHLEVNRNNSGFKVITGYKDFIIPKVWSPFSPLEHLAPLTLIIIGQLFIAATAPGATAAGTALLAATYTFKIIVLPIALNDAVLIGGMLLRNRYEYFMKRCGIDPSGHALAQSASAIYKLFVFVQLSRFNFAYNLYRATAAVTTLSDYLWTHRTASSYHSVMDMAVTTVYMGISFSAVYTCFRTIAVYAPGAFRVLVAV